MNDPAAIIVRSAEPHDVAALLRMKDVLQIEDGGEDSFLAAPELWVQDMFGPERHFDAQMAEHGASPVGMLTFNLKHYTGWPAAALYVQDLFVEPPYRCKGIGLLLLRRLAQHALRTGAQHIELVVRADNPARWFFERAGFFRIEEVVTYIGGRATIETLAAPPR